MNNNRWIRSSPLPQPKINEDNYRLTDKKKVLSCCQGDFLPASLSLYSSLSSIAWSVLLEGDMTGCGWLYSYSPDQFPLHMFKARVGIHSCVACLWRVALTEPIPLRFKPQPMHFNLKTCLGHGHMVVDSTGWTFNFILGDPPHVKSSPQ